MRLVEHMGSDLYVHLDMAGAAGPVIARLLAERAPQIATSQTVNLGVRPERMLLLTRGGQRIRSHASIAQIPTVHGIASATPIRELVR